MYSELSNKHAAKISFFVTFFPPTIYLIRTSTFIYFRGKFPLTRLLLPPHLVIFWEILNYRLSHGKVNKVIWLCWGYSFRFLLIFWFLWVHEKGTFMLNASVFIFFMLRALYGSITQNLLFLNKFWIILIFRGLFQVIESNKPSKNIFFLKLKVFWWIEAVEVIEATEVVEAVEVILRPFRSLMPGKSLNM
jgi:hypothetical protein